MMSISIHAPTRGATRHGTSVFKLWKFQSTLPREERQFLIEFGTSQSYFNPRSHERSDRVEEKKKVEERNFNPRSHERSDRNPLVYKSQKVISIHAPTRGATILIVVKFIRG